MKKSIFLYAFVSLLTGIVSGFFGAGGGMILVPFMSLIMEKDEVTVRSTTIFCVFFLVLVSSYFYYKENSIDLILSIKCAIGGIIGSVIGSKLLINLDKRILEILFIVFLIYSGVSLII